MLSVLITKPNGMEKIDTRHNLGNGLVGPD